MTEIRAIGDRTTNAELMRDCAALGYLDGPVLDATYGEGRFWNLYRPELLTTNDLNPALDTHWHIDFQAFPPWMKFAAVVFDPPYKLNGTSTGVGPSALDAGYGVAEYRTVQQKHRLVKNGIESCARIAERYLLVKCQDQVCSGVKHWQTHIFTRTAARYGFDLVDMLHVQGYREQPHDRQLHAHGDYSTLLVLERT